jgi:hypothetical protein
MNHQEKSMPKRSSGNRRLLRQNLSNAKRLYPDLPKQQLSVLRDLTSTLRLSISRTELLFFTGKWYVTHSGLLRIAHRRRCFGIGSSRAICSASYPEREELSEVPGPDTGVGPSTGRKRFRADASPSRHGLLISSPQAEPGVQIPRTGLPR